MLRKLALLSACISCFGTVLATTAKSQAEPVSTSRWSGTYIGLTAGYAGFGVNVDDGDLAPLAPYTEGERNAPDGFLGGVVLGHDFQNGR
jgi:opacity protein-like surface antigen